MRLPRVGADRFDAEADHVALLDHELHRRRRRPRRMRAIRPHIGVFSALALRPVRAHQQPRARRDPPMLGLERRYMLGLQQEVVVRRASGGAVDHHRRPDELLYGDRIDRVVRQVLAGHPMRGRVEMRAGMLAHRDVVPVPGRPLLVVAADQLLLERRGRAELRRQLDRRKLLVERLREIDHAQAPAGDAGREGAQDFVGVHKSSS